jgi:hypothetical protein
MKRNLKAWLAEGNLRHHEPTRQEVAQLLHLVDRDLGDAGLAGLSFDRCFATAYNAILQLSTAIIRASGYRTSGTGHHWMTFQVLAEILDPAEEARVDYFDSCRRKRNFADYDRAGSVTEAEAAEIVAEAQHFRIFVVRWLRDHQPDLSPDS